MPDLIAEGAKLLIQWQVHHVVPECKTLYVTVFGGGTLKQPGGGG